MSTELKCPRCGKSPVFPKEDRQKKVAVGKAAVGGVLLGPAGAIIGGLSGKEVTKISLVCGSCGHEFKLGDHLKNGEETMRSKELKASKIAREKEHERIRRNYSVARLEQYEVQMKKKAKWMLRLAWLIPIGLVIWVTGHVIGLVIIILSALGLRIGWNGFKELENVLRILKLDQEKLDAELGNDV